MDLPIETARVIALKNKGNFELENESHRGVFVKISNEVFGTIMEAASTQSLRVLAFRFSIRKNNTLGQPEFW